MSLIGRLLGLDINDERLWSSYGNAEVSQAGVRVDAETALKISTVWAGVRLIANSIGMLPMGVFERLARGRREAPEHPLWGLLHTRPNASQTAAEFKAMLTAHALLRGDGFARIVPGPRGPVDQLVPIHPDRVTVERLSDYRLRYQVKPESGVGPAETLLDDEMFHLRGLTLDGLTGVSFIKYGVDSLGLAKAGEGYAGRVFANDSTPRGVLKTKRQLSPKAAERMKADWESLHSGPNQHRIAVLEEETDFQAISVSPQDTQLLDSREYQDVDIARWLGVPLFLLQIMTKSTSWGSGIAEMWQAFIATGLGDWATRWEQCIGRDLITVPGKYYVKINLNALVRGDIEKRFAAYNTGIMAGFMAPNEARELEDWNPLPGLDTPRQPLNMQDAPAAPAAPAANQDHYRALLRASAARVLRKEIAALTNAGRRCGDAQEWEREVRKFYAVHGNFVAQVMQIPPALAQEYTDAQQMAALEFGVSGVAFDEGAAVNRLREMAELAEVS